MTKLISAASGKRTIIVSGLYVCVGVFAGLTGLMAPGDAIQAVFEGLIGIFLRLGISKA
jgi:hypothetical protein